MGNLPKTRREFLASPLVAEFSDERSTGDGYWAYLVRGFWNPELETHCVHEGTIAELARAFRAVEPCGCERCADEDRRTV